mmetsp:Transcript_36254/g.67317  ORF Transcript_36254/g.67317 Transcript_36254/m.67317 type:complete len:84 (-) Transcript_36254:140-391(-)
MYGNTPGLESSQLILSSSLRYIKNSPDAMTAAAAVAIPLPASQASPLADEEKVKDNFRLKLDPRLRKLPQSRLDDLDRLLGSS